jgi:hypothetical protein
MARLYPAVLGIYGYLDDLMNAVRAVQRQRLEYTVYTPILQQEIQAEVAPKPSPVRFFTLAGGILGIVAGLSLALYTVLQWKFIVSGKPVVPWVPFVIIAFESCILFGVLATVAGLLITARLPRRGLPAHYDPRFSCDRFGILVRCPNGSPEAIVAMLQEAGAEEVHQVHG